MEKGERRRGARNMELGGKNMEAGTERMGCEAGNTELGNGSVSQGKIVRFEDLRVWQLAVDLAAKVYDAFTPCRDFTLKDQIQRAAISVSSNIAEGYERGSNREFVHFLYYAKGSCGEARSQAHLARHLKFLTDIQAEQLIVDARTLSGKLGSFIKVRETRFT
jgi:four helix bundle protein